MMDDITPELLDKIKKEFDQLLKEDKTINEVMGKIAEGTANYHDANAFALSLGDILSKAYGDNLSSNVLPDGKMYYNIAKRIIDPTMRNNYDLISETTLEIQSLLNKQANIGIKAIKPELDQENIDNIINKISAADKYDDVSWMLDAPIQHFSQSIVDETIRANAEFHSKSGMKPKIVRRLAGNCCDWCRALAGTYSYPDVPKDVYRRHNNCRCIVEYHPGDGKVQDVHTKQWKTEEERAKIETRKVIAEKTPIKRTDPQYIRFHDGDEVNNFFYYDDEARGILAKKRSSHSQWEKSLSLQQKKSISSYCADGFADINSYWRKYGDWENINVEKVLAQTKDLDDAISNYTLKENIQVYRAIRSDAFEKYWDDMQMLVGTEYSDPAFMSTSPFRGSSAVNKECIMVLDIPAGKGRGAYVNDLSPFKDKEYEFLLARDSKFIIQAVEEKEDEVIIRMEMRP